MYKAEIYLEQGFDTLDCFVSLADYLFLNLLTSRYITILGSRALVLENGTE